MIDTATEWLPQDQSQPQNDRNALSSVTPCKFLCCGGCCTANQVLLDKSPIWLHPLLKLDGCQKSVGRHHDAHRHRVRDPWAKPLWTTSRGHGETGWAVCRTACIWERWTCWLQGCLRQDAPGAGLELETKQSGRNCTTMHPGVPVDSPPPQMLNRNIAVKANSTDAVPATGVRWAWLRSPPYAHTTGLVCRI